MNTNKIWRILGILCVLCAIIIIPNIKAANTIGGNYKNVTVRTYVNVTNARPEILGIFVYQDTNWSLRNVTLSGGSTKTVNCNVTLRDWNGYGDISNVNATIYFNGTAVDAPDDHNDHYSNDTCLTTGNGVNYTVNWICSFQVYYHANNGTWICNVSVNDTKTAHNSRTNSTVFLPLYALNVTDGIDYGNVPVEDYSANVTANITNFGNRAINVTVQGYGVNMNDGLAMNCSLGGNITISNEHYSLTDVDFASMTTLTGNPAMLAGLTIPQQTVDNTPNTNTTYWQLFVSSANNPGGNCTGYVLFSAEIP